MYQGIIERKTNKFIIVTGQCRSFDYTYFNLKEWKNLTWRSLTIMSIFVFYATREFQGKTMQKDTLDSSTCKKKVPTGLVMFVIKVIRTSLFWMIIIEKFMAFIRLFKIDLK